MSQSLPVTHPRAVLAGAGSSPPPPTGSGAAAETWVLLAGMLVTYLHAVDELLVQRQPGIDLGRHVGDLGVVGALMLVACLSAVLLPGRVGTVVRIALAVAVGSVAAADGATHVLRMAAGHGGGADVSGLVEAVLGVALIGVALRIAWRLVRSPARARMRWARAGVATLVSLTIAFLVAMPLAVGTVQVRLPRHPVAPPPDDSYQPVSLSTEDGLRIAGWYRRSTNGSAVMVLNSARGDHSAAHRHASLLAAHGFGVLVYDARGTGGSEGEPNGWGWGWAADVDAGMDFLTARPDVIAGRVGVLGLSTGADVAIEAAAHDPRIKAVVADGATASQFADRPAGALAALTTWPMFATAALWSGGRPGIPVHAAIGRIAPRPVLLVASGSIAVEIPLNREYAERGGQTTVLWSLPDVDHTQALDQVPDDYERRVLGFLRDALQGP